MERLCLAMLMLMVGASAIGLIAFGASTWAQEVRKHAQPRFWARWAKTGRPFTLEDFARFEKQFPTKCAVCSMVRFAYRSDLDFYRLQVRHYCVEQSRRRRTPLIGIDLDPTDISTLPASHPE